MRDNDTNIKPDSSEINAVNDAILEIKPAHTSDQDVRVQAFDDNLVDYDFTKLTPDTPSMRTNIVENLKAGHIDQVSLGEDWRSDTYRSIINNTTDSSGQQVKSFTLSSPVGNVPSTTTQLATFNSASFPS